MGSVTVTGTRTSVVSTLRGRDVVLSPTDGVFTSGEATALPGAADEPAAAGVGEGAPIPRGVICTSVISPVCPKAVQFQIRNKSATINTELKILENDFVEAKLGRRASTRGPVRETETEGPLIPGISKPLL